MIKWTFMFNEGSVNTVVATEEEDKRIADFIESNEGSALYLKGDCAEFFVNLMLVKCITREILPAQLPPVEVKIDEVTPV